MDTGTARALKSLSLLLALALFACGANADEPVQADCPAYFYNMVGGRKVATPVRDAQDVYVRIVGRNGDLVELRQGDFTLYRAYSESRDAMGGVGKFACRDIFVTKNIIGVRAGWKYDIYHAYGVIWSANGSVIALQQLVWAERDYGFTVAHVGPDDDILLVYGRNSDRHTRLCWRATEQKWYWSSGNSRVGGYPPCDAPFPSKWERGAQRRIDVAR